MLPFSSYEFFIIMLFYIIIISICKRIFKTSFYYKYVLAILNTTFLFIIYPKPYHFFFFIIFSYITTYLFSDIIKLQKKLIGILVLLLPMLLVKFDIRFGFYPFEMNTIISFAGLSYASFRIVGYYMDKANNDKIVDFITYFNFLSFTPTLLIGPIDRLSRFKVSQQNGFNNINTNNFIIGWNILIKGIVYKYIVSELIDRYWLSKYDFSSKELFYMLNNMYAYYLYLFFDFAGYSFMALGIGKMLGMVVPLNFNNPFIATNPQDFWKRFHISLGDWLKDYFFTPLYLFFTRKKSLKKHPLFRQNIALLSTFILMGCWNGFKFNYILSGLLFGVYAVVHNTYVMKCKKAGKDIVFSDMNPLLIKGISIFIMFNLAAFAIYIFSGRCPFI